MIVNEASQVSVRAVLATKVTRVIAPTGSASFVGTKSIRILSGGFTVLRCSQNATSQTFPNLLPMTELLFEVAQVMATGTNASDS